MIPGSAAAQLSPSLIRTLIPFLFGGLLTRYGVSPDDPAVAILLTGVIGYGFYVVVRFLETFAGPKWGYVLGVAKTPGYSSGQPAGPPAGSDTGEAALQLLGTVLIVAGAVALLLALLNVITVSVLLCIVVIVVGVLLHALDRGRVR